MNFSLFVLFKEATLKDNTLKNVFSISSNIHLPHEYFKKTFGSNKNQYENLIEEGQKIVNFHIVLSDLESNRIYTYIESDILDKIVEIYKVTDELEEIWILTMHLLLEYEFYFGITGQFCPRLSDYRFDVKSFLKGKKKEK